MEKDILKVKVKPIYIKQFEESCKKYNIYFKPYPKPIVATYRVECKKEKLKGLHTFIISIENMPKIYLS